MSGCRKNIFAVFVSGIGSNLQAIIDAVENGIIKGKIGIVVSDKPNCKALECSRLANIKTFAFEPKKFSSRKEYEILIADECEKAGCEFIVLAGYMRLLSPWFVAQYKNRIINIHPSLLPNFPGTHAIQDAIEAGAKMTGCTVHFVDEGIDTGSIIAQREVVISNDDDLDSLTEKIHLAEHELYPKIVNLLCCNKIEKRQLQTLACVRKF
ncbi:TPA: phosphoribosylglycinamide formyltransferase [bacterium]|nr:MAG: phosphoribosylglycinamide formyltransferase [Candidatus Hydrogenedentes bacterium CG1_02_42_14]HBW47464.1 phosphoribosylglycinamide formyltransferase [bacterium]